MEIEIITIGDEILIGQVIDTNSGWMSKELNYLGWEVIRISTVSDKYDDIINSFEEAMQRAEVVLVTGGIGPTKDDVTKSVLLDYFGGKKIFREDIKQNIEEIFANRNIKINDSTLSQAFVPDNATILMNKVGTAPCTLFEKDGRILISMPGVPTEMKWLMENKVLPYLIEKTKETSVVIHKTFLIKNYSESALSEKLDLFEKELPDLFKLAYLPQAGIVRLRLTGRNNDENLIKVLCDIISIKLRAILGNDIFSEEDLPIEKLVANKLLEKQFTLSTAESCTGGNIAHKITLNAGSSEYFMGSVVSYSNEVKHNVLNVKQETLDRFGAVSEQVVREMLDGVSDICKTDCAVATSGIAGPAGGSVEKPVGTIWIGAKVKDKYFIKLYRFGNIREYNIEKSSNTALIMLYEMLSE